MVLHLLASIALAFSPSVGRLVDRLATEDHPDDAVRALIDKGDRAVPALSAVVRHPQNRSQQGWAILVLTEIRARDALEVLQRDSRQPHIVQLWLSAGRIALARDATELAVLWRDNPSPRLLGAHVDRLEQLHPDPADFLTGSRWAHEMLTARPRNLPVRGIVALTLRNGSHRRQAIAVVQRLGAQGHLPSAIAYRPAEWFPWDTELPTAIFPYQTMGKRRMALNLTAWRLHASREGWPTDSVDDALEQVHGKDAHDDVTWLHHLAAMGGPELAEAALDEVGNDDPTLRAVIGEWEMMGTDDVGMLAHIAGMSSNPELRRRARARLGDHVLPPEATLALVADDGPIPAGLPPAAWKPNEASRVVDWLLDREEVAYGAEQHRIHRLLADHRLQAALPASAAEDLVERLLVRYAEAELERRPRHHTDLVLRVTCATHDLPGGGTRARWKLLAWGDRVGAARLRKILQRSGLIADPDFASLPDLVQRGNRSRR